MVQSDPAANPKLSSPVLTSPFWALRWAAAEIQGPQKQVGFSCPAACQVPQNGDTESPRHAAQISSVPPGLLRVTLWAWARQQGSTIKIAPDFFRWTQRWWTGGEGERLGKSKVSQAWKIGMLFHWEISISLKRTSQAQEDAATVGDPAPCSPPQSCSRCQTSFSAWTWAGGSQTPSLSPLQSMGTQEEENVAASQSPRIKWEPPATLTQAFAPKISLGTTPQSPVPLASSLPETSTPPPDWAP